MDVQDATMSHTPSIVISPANGVGNDTATKLTDARSVLIFAVTKPAGRIGLVNQAMTCYLNSLLQALYMTPEFRNALYKWEFLGQETEKASSIPYQLQKLFLNLQTSKRNAVETTSLTRSFGWYSSEAWHQHDIQELCRVMFDALERKFSNTEQADFIQRLYGGKMIDYVKCLECGTEKTREDTFLDIPLPVRPFGDQIAYGDVGEALDAFVLPETLDGNNQYFCEKCNQKCDAQKGLKFSHFPYILTLHLKRFDFDYNTMQRIKLNDKIGFPEFLNINGYVGMTGDKRPAPDDATSKTETPQNCSVDVNGLKPDSNGCQNNRSTNSEVSSCSEEEEGIDGTSESSTKKERDVDKKSDSIPGPYIYELFSIMIHSGSASGGHYYAYIKDFETNEWLCYNDEVVTLVPKADIMENFCGSRKRSYTGALFSSTPCMFMYSTPYMLMYRQIDKEKNASFIKTDGFPEHIKVLAERVQKEDDGDGEKSELTEAKGEKIKVHYEHGDENEAQETPRRKVRTVMYTAQESLNDVLEILQDVFSLQDVPVTHLRLAAYNAATEEIIEEIKNDRKELLKNLLPQCPSPYDLLLYSQPQGTGEWKNKENGDCRSDPPIASASASSDSQDARPSNEHDKPAASELSTCDEASSVTEPLPGLSSLQAFAEASAVVSPDESTAGNTVCTVQVNSKPPSCSIVVARENAISAKSSEGTQDSPSSESATVVSDVPENSSAFEGDNTISANASEVAEDSLDSEGAADRYKSRYYYVKTNTAEAKARRLRRKCYECTRTLDSEGQEQTETATTTRCNPPGRIGLVNQAMTCYLNSLLQALYMTPEFRNALYKWEFLGQETEMASSIPYQLQKLFLNLQTSKRKAVETTCLTRSFGWDSSEAWHQHDIQELCRVMFDALERKFSNTEQADFIQRLYGGKMIDYVKCLECGTEKTREDTFLDIPLPVRPFGNQIAYGDIGEALDAFVQPETLDGNNQYFCEKCNQKCDAQKGLKFSHFPYILTLHLNRFDFDYNTMQRIKLNDKIGFPEVLNVNSYVGLSGDKPPAPDDAISKTEMPQNCSVDVNGLKSDSNDCQNNRSTGSEVSSCSEEDEGIDGSSESSRKKKRHVDKKSDSIPGPYIYELFSIMIHSGSASGGHYYAYIKDFETNEWFCFNDEVVTLVPNADILENFCSGRQRSYTTTLFSSTPYMLMYRQIDKEKNTSVIKLDEFPEHIKVLAERVQKEDDGDIPKSTRFHRRVAGRDEDGDQSELTEPKAEKIKVHYEDGDENETPEPRRRKVRTLMYTPQESLNDVLEILKVVFFLEDVPVTHLRLAAYNAATEEIIEEIKNDRKELLKNLLPQLPSPYELLLYSQPPGTGVNEDQPEQSELTEAKAEKIKVHYEGGDENEATKTRRREVRTLMYTPQMSLNCVLEMLKVVFFLEDVPVTHLRLAAYNAATEEIIEEIKNDRQELLKNLLPQLPPPYELLLYRKLQGTGVVRIKPVSLDTKDSWSCIRVEISEGMTVGDVRKQLTTELGSVSLPVSRVLVLVKDRVFPDDTTIEATRMLYRDSYVVFSRYRDFTDEDAKKCLLEIAEKSTFLLKTRCPLRGLSKVFLKRFGTNLIDIHYARWKKRATGTHSAADVENGGTAFFNAQWEQSASEDSSLTDTENTSDEDTDRVLEKTISIQNSPLSSNSSVPTPDVPGRTEGAQSEDTDDYGFVILRIQNSVLTIKVDSRMSLLTFKSLIAQYIGMPLDYVKLCTGNVEYSCLERSLHQIVSRSKNKDFAKSEFRIDIDIQKPLTPGSGESYWEIYSFDVTEQECPVPCFTCVLNKSMTVAEAKNVILEEMRERRLNAMPLNRCRLRRKRGLKPGSVLPDDRTLRELSLTLHELVVQKLDGPEPVEKNTQVLVMVSKFPAIDRRELVLDSDDVETFVQKVSSESGIPMKYLEVRTSSFWRGDPSIAFFDDGNSFSYRDRRERRMKPKRKDEWEKLTPVSSGKEPVSSDEESWRTTNFTFTADDPDGSRQLGLGRCLFVDESKKNSLSNEKPAPASPEPLRETVGKSLRKERGLKIYVEPNPRPGSRIVRCRDRQY